jgi:hypothetical protein
MHATNYISLGHPLPLTVSTVAAVTSLPGKYGYLDQWCECGSAKQGPGVCGLSADCRPVTAQVVATTTLGRVLIAGMGSDEVHEVRDGMIAARYSNGSNAWGGRADGAPLLYSHLYHGEVYDATQETGGAAYTALTPWTKPMGPLSPHSFPAVRPSEPIVQATAAWVSGAHPSTMDSAALGLASSCCGCCAMLGFQQEVTLDGSICAHT